MWHYSVCKRCSSVNLKAVLHRSMSVCVRGMTTLRKKVWDGVLTRDRTDTILRESIYSANCASSAMDKKEEGRQVINRKFCCICRWEINEDWATAWHIYRPKMYRPSIDKLSERETDCWCFSTSAVTSIRDDTTTGLLLRLGQWNTRLDHNSLYVESAIYIKAIYIYIQYISILTMVSNSI